MMMKLTTEMAKTVGTISRIRKAIYRATCELLRPGWFVAALHVKVHGHDLVVQNRWHPNCQGPVRLSDVRRTSCPKESHCRHLAPPRHAQPKGLFANT